MPKTVKAKIVNVSENDETKLFAVGSQPKEYYFVHRNGVDSGFFDFVYGNVSEGGKKFDVELSTSGREATLVTPKQFIDIHRNGLVYVVDTNYPEYIMQPTSMWAVNQMFLEFAQDFMKINPYISFPCAATKSDSLGLYHGRGNTIFKNDPFGQDMGIEEKARVLDGVVTGKHKFLQGRSRVHLIVNPAGNIHDPTFQALTEHYGHKVERHTVNQRE